MSTSEMQGKDFFDKDQIVSGDTFPTYGRTHGRTDNSKISVMIMMCVVDLAPCFGSLVGSVTLSACHEIDLLIFK